MSGLNSLLSVFRWSLKKHCKWQRSLSYLLKELLISNLSQSTFVLLFLPYTVLSQSVLLERRFISCHQNFAHYPLFVFCEVPDIEHLCEKHCQLEEFINKEMNRLRTEGQLCRTVLPLYKIEKNAFKVSFLNARSLHKHINDIRTDLNYSSSDVCIFSETRLSHSDIDNDYSLDGYSLFRNDEVDKNEK